MRNRPAPDGRRARGRSSRAPGADSLPNDCPAMVDLTDDPYPRAMTEVEADDRPSFRRRLLTTVGPALAVVVGGLALLAWGAAYWTFHHNAVETLEGEISEMRADVRVEGDSLIADGYAWAEAHHRLAVERVDPIFVQVYDTENRLLRQSANIDSLDGVFPKRLIAGRTPETFLPVLRTFSVGERTLYYRVQPLLGAEGTPVGFVQVARAVPDHQGWLRQFGLGLAALWLLLTGGLLGLVAWAAQRVLKPLRDITAVAQSVSSADLDTRVDVPAATDRETALLGRTLNALLDRIQAYVETLRTFTSNAAHELQTPLTVLRGHVEIALRRERSAAEYRETMQLLDDRLGDLVRTLRALLTLTRLDRTGSMETERVELAGLVAEEAESFQPRAESGDVDLAVSVPEDRTDTWVNAQPELVREAVRNLVDNALKYTPEGQVTVRVQATPNWVVVSCRDTGIGIDPEDLPKVSDQFYRSDAAGQTAPDGSGLGLSIVRRIVDRHGGRLQAESSPGEGTCIQFALPQVEARETSGAVSRTERETSPPPIPESKKTSS